MPYRNWPAICEVSSDNRLLMTLLATIDLATDRGQRLSTVFPECFSDELVQGPIPLSLLRFESFELYRKDYPEEAKDTVLTSYDSLTPRGIPYLSFDIKGRNIACGDFPTLPEHIAKDSPFGSVVEHEGKQWVVVENNDSCEELHIAPLECVDPGA